MAFTRGPNLCLALTLCCASWAGAQQNGGPSISGPSSPVPELANHRIYDSLRERLQELTRWQDELRDQTGRFTTDFTPGNRVTPLALPPGVTITLLFARSDGYAAAASHQLLPGRNCTVWVGNVPPPLRPKTLFDENRGSQGEIVCDLVP